MTMTLRRTGREPRPAAAALRSARRPRRWLVGRTDRLATGIVLVGLLLAGTVQPGSLEAAGLWRAQVVDYRIVMFSPILKVVATWGTFGHGAGQFQFPRGVAVDRNGTVYVADWGNHRVQRFSPEGRFLSTWGERRFNELGGAFSPTDIAVTRSGEVVGFADHRVHRFTPSGHLLGRWGLPFPFASRSGIAINAHGHVLGITGHSELDRPQVLTFDRTGTLLAAWAQYGRGVGQLFDSITLAVDAAGRVDVAHPLNPRVMAFDTRGTVLHQWDARSGSAPGLTFPACPSTGGSAHPQPRRWWA